MTASMNAECRLYLVCRAASHVHCTFYDSIRHSYDIKVQILTIPICKGYLQPARKHIPMHDSVAHELRAINPYFLDENLLKHLVELREEEVDLPCSILGHV